MSQHVRACPSCSTPLPDEAHFCMHCGSATPPDSGVPPRTMPTGAVEVAKVRQSLGGRFRVERILGEGGMATVYLAEDLKHHRRVAVKVMRPELAATLGAERFLREVEIAAQLSHPHILPMHDSGEADGLLYYVMPYVEGESLHARLARETQLPVADAIRIAREVAEALAYAHKRGIVHRDIKPANILLADGHAMVADFGIARAMSSDGEALTRTGLAVGTPHYMSPEQATGGEIDGRTDVYALGAVLYEMLAGEPPFTGPTPQVVMSRSITEDARPVSSTRVGLPAALEQVVRTALAKSPADRHATAGALAAALQAIAEGPTSTPTPAPPSAAATGDGARHAGAAGRRRRLTTAIGALAAVVLLAAGTVYATRGDELPAGADGVRVAVLPFENQGDSSDAYFADGIADEVRGKLVRVEGLRVIASASTRQYRGNSRPLTEIARELGADYLLTGRVRWVGSGEGRRVQVVPELVDGRTGAADWQDTYDAAITDVFEMQSRIAAEVSAELGRQLGTQEQQALAERPTESVAAWELYQKGRAITSRDPQPARQAAAFYEQAVVLDTTFVEAWSQLSIALGFAYFNGSRDAAAAARSRQAFETARQLDPDAAATNMAGTLYHTLVEPDTAAAAHYGERALRAAPRDAEVLSRTAALDLDAGRLGEARAKLELARELDPRSALTAGNLAGVYLQLGDIDAARSTAEAAYALSPGDAGTLQQRVFVELAAGDLAAARRVVRGAIGPTLPAPEVAARFAGVFETAWVLEPSEQELLFRLTPGAFDDDRSWWAQAFATAHWQRGDTVLARAWADTALAPSAEAATSGGQPQLRALYGLMLAYLQRHAEARREIELALAEARDASAQERDYVLEQAVRIHLAAGERDRAMDRLEELLRRPYHLTPAWVRIDPTYASLRGHPRFERLTAQR